MSTAPVLASVPGKAPERPRMKDLVGTCATPTQRAVYAVLCDFANPDARMWPCWVTTEEPGFLAWPAVATIAEISGVCERAVRLALRGLETLGAITAVYQSKGGAPKKKRLGQPGAPGRANCYSITGHLVPRYSEPELGISSRITRHLVPNNPASGAPDLPNEVLREHTQAAATRAREDNPERKPQPLPDTSNEQHQKPPKKAPASDTRKRSFQDKCPEQHRIIQSYFPATAEATCRKLEAEIERIVPQSSDLEKFHILRKLYKKPKQRNVGLWFRRLREEPDFVREIIEILRRTENRGLAPGQCGACQNSGLMDSGTVRKREDETQDQWFARVLAIPEEKRSEPCQCAAGRALRAGER